MESNEYLFKDNKLSEIIGCNGVLRFLELWIELYEKAPTVNEVQCFLLIMMHDGRLTQDDIVNIFRRKNKRIKAAHISRYLYSLGEGKLNQVTKSREVGKNLIYQKESHENRRKKLLYLTSQGKVLADKIFNIF